MVAEVVCIEDGEPMNTLKDVRDFINRENWTEVYVIAKHPDGSFHSACTPMSHREVIGLLELEKMATHQEFAS